MPRSIAASSTLWSPVKDSNRLIVYESVEHADDTVVCFGNNIFVLKIENNAWEFNRFFIMEK